VQDWEAVHGKIPKGAVVLMNNGWASRYPNATAVFNTNTPTDPSTFRFPGIHPNAAAFLTNQVCRVQIFFFLPLSKSVAFFCRVIEGTTCI
jgi:kynurenine formamidase